MATSRMARDMVVGVSWPVSIRKYCPLPWQCLRDGADGFDGLRVKRVGRIFGNKTAMRLHLEDAELLGKVGRLAQGIDARGAGLGRHQADGRRAMGKVPLQRARAHHFDRGGGELVLGEQIAELGGQAPA